MKTAKLFLARPNDLGPGLQRARCVHSRVMSGCAECKGHSRYCSALGASRLFAGRNRVRHRPSMSTRSSPTMVFRLPLTEHAHLLFPSSLPHKKLPKPRHAEEATK